MAAIVDYAIVLQTLTAQGLKCLHYNGGVFGFLQDTPVRHVGWLTGDDPTLTAVARASAHLVSPPTSSTLSRGLIETWTSNLAGPLWILPGSHWAYELTYGGQKKLADLLNRLSIAPDSLSNRTTADAIAFELSDIEPAMAFCTHLLDLLNVTDFTAIWPQSRVTALLHHHRQIWWTLPENWQNEAAESVSRFGRPIDKR